MTKEKYIAEKLDLSVSKIVAQGVKDATIVGTKIKATALGAIQTKDISRIRPIIIEELQPRLMEIMLLCHLRGMQFSYSQTPGHPGLELGVFSKVVALLKKKLSLNLNKLQERYNTQALKILNDVSVNIERKLQLAVTSVIESGVHLKEGVETLRAKFNSVGLSTTSDFTLETIFRTQSQIATAAGKWEADQDPVVQEILWGYKYVTVGDDRVRPTHEALDGTTLPKEDPFWQRFWPPNGWNCRCQAISIFEEREVQHPPRTLQEDGVELPIKPDPGFEFNAGKVFGGTTLSFELQEIVDLARGRKESLPFKLSQAAISNGISLYLDFNEMQPRGSDGRWISVGGTASYKGNAVKVLKMNAKGKVIIQNPDGTKSWVQPHTLKMTQGQAQPKSKIDLTKVGPVKVGVPKVNVPKVDVPKETAVDKTLGIKPLFIPPHLHDLPVGSQVVDTSVSGAVFNVEEDGGDHVIASVSMGLGSKKFKIYKSAGMKSYHSSSPIKTPIPHVTVKPNEEPKVVPLSKSNTDFKSKLPGVKPSIIAKIEKVNPKGFDESVSTPHLKIPLATSDDEMYQIKKAFPKAILVKVNANKYLSPAPLASQTPVEQKQTLAAKLNKTGSLSEAEWELSKALKDKTSSKSENVTPPVSDAYHNAHGWKTPEYTEKYKAWKNDLSSKEVSAIESFTNGGYGAIREYEAGIAEGHPNVKEMSEAIHSAMAKAPPAAGAVCYRGMGLKEDSKLFKELTTKGGTVEITSHSSSSVHENVALDFARGNLTKGRSIVIIKVKTKTGVDVKPLSEHPSEAEILLRKGSKYTVKSISVKKVELKHSSIKEASHYTVELEEHD